MGSTIHSVVAATCRKISSKLTSWPILIIYGLSLVVAVAWAVNHARELAVSRIDSQIVADVNALMDTSLESFSSSDAILRECGTYKSWEPVDWYRTITFKMKRSYLGISGTAHFERADVRVAVTITKGQLLPPTLKRFPQDQWLKEHPEVEWSIQDEMLGPVRMRRVVVDNPPARIYVYIEGSANHPDFQPGWSGLGPHMIESPK